MNPIALLADLSARGVRVTLAPDGAHLDLEPADLLTAEDLALAREYKPALITLIREQAEPMRGARLQWPPPPEPSDPEYPSWIAAGRPPPGSLSWKDWREGRPQRYPARSGATPQEVFRTALHAALDRLSRFVWSQPGDDDAARAVDLELDLAAAALDGDDPEALDRALEALRRWETAWAQVRGPGATRSQLRERQA